MVTKIFIIVDYNYNLNCGFKSIYFKFFVLIRFVADINQVYIYEFK